MGATAPRRSRMPSRRKPHRPQDTEAAVEAALALLLGGYEFALHTGRSPADCGLPHSLLRRLGVSDEAVLAAVDKGYVACSPPTSRRGETSDCPLGPHTLITLTEKGAKRAWQDACARHRPPPGRATLRKPAGAADDASKPHWDKKTGSLWRGDDLILRVRRRSSFQWLLLEAFHRRGWRPSVDDPLGHTKGYRLERLRQTVKDLNRRQKPLRLRFEVEADGQSVCWYWLD